LTRGRPLAHPDPWRDIDGRPHADQLATVLETRGRAASQARLRRRFLRFVPVRGGDAVLEVGCGTGVVVRDLLRLVAPRGRVVGVDRSRHLLTVARRLQAARPPRARAVLRKAEGARLPFREASFDVALAVTVILHVADPLAVVREMARVTRPGGRVALQDQDFGLVAAAHPDQDLTEHILQGVARRMYAEPHSGRRLPALLREAGLDELRLLTDVYQDTTLEAFSKAFLERRAENAVRFGLVGPRQAQAWLDGFTALVAQGTFVLTMNYFGAVGVKPRLGARP
jgi:ubiquinone/menaquinone biosynthesis C-methylase UbiE